VTNRQIKQILKKNCKSKGLLLKIDGCFVGLPNCFQG